MKNRGHGGGINDDDVVEDVVVVEVVVEVCDMEVEAF